jgi:ABC-type sugar transport system substrate-binding protein
MGVQAAFDAINGKDVPPTIDTGTEMVTSDNVDQFQ